VVECFDLWFVLGVVRLGVINEIWVQKKRKR